MSGTGLHTIWRLVENVSPLTGKSQSGVAALVAKSDVTIHINSFTGCAEVNSSRGDAIIDLKKSILNTIKFVSFFLFLVLLYYFYKMYGQYVEKRDREELVQWISNFYEHNAPEVSI